ncbi:MAG TPA: hypothetical protein ENJ18_05340 [Nannocystis exedens]|nr:hypothetical protein [Nannocystis exedens]
MDGPVLLNPAQQAAVDHRGGPLLVLAGAGTGKTRVLTHRIASLLDEGVPPWRILAVTFTNKAAGEMRERIAAIAGEIHDVKGLWVGTFHSICARILRRFGRPVGLSPHFSIYDTSDQLAVMKQVFQDLNISSDNPSGIRPKVVLGYLDQLKNRGHGVERIDELKLDEPGRTLAFNAMQRYERKVRADDAADFGDLLVLTVKLLRKADMSAPSRRRSKAKAKAKEKAKEKAGGGTRLVARRASPARRNKPEPQTSSLSAFGQELAGLIDFARPNGGSRESLQTTIAGTETQAVEAPAGSDDLASETDAGTDGSGHAEGAQLTEYVDPIQDDLERVARLRRRFAHILVDEFQDTNPVQAELVELLATFAELCVVGDDDQAIYGWRGADVSQILNFPESHSGCEAIALEQNYRSTTHILDGANAIIRKNRHRFGKALRSDLGEGEPIRVLMTVDEVDEARAIAGLIADDLAEGVDPAEIAVFYRTHALSRALEEALIRRQVHYKIYGGLRFFDRKEIKDLLSYLHLMVNPQSDLHLRRIINVPGRKIGKRSLDRLLERARIQECSLFEVLTADEASAAGLGKAAVGRVVGVRQLLSGLREMTQGRGLGEIAEVILQVTDYRKWIGRDESEESSDRLENIQEFVGELMLFSEEEPEATLADYLEQVALLSPADDGEVEGEGEDEKNNGLGAVTLMTVHSAKGLEFSRVYLTGMEEGLFPHARVLDDPEEMEGERRLAYVAVTRAKRRLMITWARGRRLYGQEREGELSRFVRELPAEASAALCTPRARVSASAPMAASWTPEFRRTESAPPPEDTWNSDIVYDQEALAADAYAAQAPVDTGEGVALFIGMRVRHRKFGVARVMGWSGAGDSLKLSLRFDTHGTKTILARFCEPA